MEKYSQGCSSNWKLVRAFFPHHELPYCAHKVLYPKDLWTNRTKLFHVIFLILHHNSRLCVHCARDYMVRIGLELREIPRYINNRDEKGRKFCVIVSTLQDDIWISEKCSVEKQINKQTALLLLLGFWVFLV